MSSGERVRKFILIFSILFLTKHIYGNEVYTLEKIERLKNAGILSQEDYEVFKSEIQGKDLEGTYIYELRVDRNTLNENYIVIKKEEKLYFPILEFFKTIGFKNYEIKENKIIFFLGRTLDMSTLDISSKNLDVVKEREDYFIESFKFKELFLREFTISEDEKNINMYTSFDTPKEVSIYTRNMLEHLEEEKQKETLFYTNKAKVFDIGYSRFNFGGILERKKEEENNDFKTDWYGDLEYQGGLLFGEITGAYDIKEKEVGDIYLRYPEIWKQHTLEVGSYNAGKKSRDNGFSFRKERGYYQDGKNYIIRENVPIGSRVELLYLGFPIEVKDSLDGVVEFSNSEIKIERQYQLRVHTPEGQTYIIDINTAPDYYQQNEGEIEYNIDVRENNDSKKVKTVAEIYYGVTEHLTIGGGYLKEPESYLRKNQNKEYEYLESLRGETIYSNYMKRNPYVLVLGAEKAINSYENQENYSEKDRYSYDFTGQIDIKNFTIITENIKYGKFYDEKYENKISFIYNPFSFLRINYDYTKIQLYDNSKESDYEISVGFNRGIKNLLVTTEYSKGKDDDHRYSAKFYYTGFDKFNVKFVNKWSNNGKDYQGDLVFFNKNIWDLMDFDLQFSYSNIDKDSFTVRFTLDYENWFRTGALINKNGSQRYLVGIDRVVDLKNVTENMESINRSRVKVVTFVDKNKNNIWDAGEERVDNVEILISDKKVITDDNGEAIIYGIPNNILYDLKPKIRKPSYILGAKKINVRGKSVGTIEVDIPIQPLLGLEGNIEVAKNLELLKTSIYEDMLVKIRDQNNIIDLISIESDGTFQVSGLLDKEYTVDISYLGNKIKLEPLSTKIKIEQREELANSLKLYIDSDGIYVVEKDVEELNEKSI